MNDPSHDPAVPQAADPAAAAVVARVKRLMLVTMAATFVALAIVLVFIGYRLFNAGGSAPVADRVLPLPSGAKVLSSTVAEGRIVVTVEIGGAAEILDFDQKTLKPLGRIKLVPQ